MSGEEPDPHTQLFLGLALVVATLANELVAAGVFEKSEMVDRLKKLEASSETDFAKLAVFTVTQAVEGKKPGKPAWFRDVIAGGKPPDEPA